MTLSIENINWQQGFSSLGPTFFSSVTPTPLPEVYWVAISDDVAKELGLSPNWDSENSNLQILAGNLIIKNSLTYATVYSGHQFGVWAGQLGDGRAIHLGTVGTNEHSLELQLKGAGCTLFSRMGDGRAVLRSSIREFLCSEAMAGLGIPTTRALSLVGSNLEIAREELETAAVVARVAPTFIRFGHFEHFSSLQNYEALKKLADYVITNHYQDLSGSPTPYLGLLDAVITRSAKLVAKWQAIGFCHGVLNTDNMSIIGLTLDYGPYSFIDSTDLKYICNHSDTGGRYSFINQPNVFHWNLVRLAEALLPLIAPDQEDALIDNKIEAIKSLLMNFPKIYEQEYQEEMRLKLGLSQPQSALIEKLILLLDNNRIDYTYFFRRLCDVVESTDPQTISVIKDLFIDSIGIEKWINEYLNLLPVGAQKESIASEMRQKNPKYILRQYLAQEVIEKAQQGDFKPLHRLHKCLQNPFAEQPEFEDMAKLPPILASDIEVSCSS
jgi:uncharacterized protein YdiU (UPF0061 family)